MFALRAECTDTLLACMTKSIQSLNFCTKKLMSTFEKWETELL